MQFGYSSHPNGGISFNTENAMSQNNESRGTAKTVPANPIMIRASQSEETSFPKDSTRPINNSIFGFEPVWHSKFGDGIFSNFQGLRKDDEISFVGFCVGAGFVVDPNKEFNEASGVGYYVDGKFRLVNMGIHPIEPQDYCVPVAPQKGVYNERVLSGVMKISHEIEKESFEKHLETKKIELSTLNMESMIKHYFDWRWNYGMKIQFKCIDKSTVNPGEPGLFYFRNV